MVLFLTGVLCAGLMDSYELADSFEFLLDFKYFPFFGVFFLFFVLLTEITSRCFDFVSILSESFGSS